MSLLFLYTNYQLLKSRNNTLTSLCLVQTTLYSANLRKSSMHWVIYFILHSEIPSSKSLLNNYSIWNKWTQCWTARYSNSTGHKHWKILFPSFPKLLQMKNIQKYRRRQLYSVTWFFGWVSVDLKINMWISKKQANTLQKKKKCQTPSGVSPVYFFLVLCQYLQNWKWNIILIWKSKKEN